MIRKMSSLERDVSILTSSRREQEKRRSPGREGRNSTKKREKEPSEGCYIHSSVWIGWTRLVWATIARHWNHDISHFFCCHLFPSILGPFLSIAPFFRGGRERKRKRQLNQGRGAIVFLLTQPSMTCFLLRVFGCLTSILPAARPWPSVPKKCKSNNNKSDPDVL